MKTQKQIEWIYRIYKSIDNICKIELKLVQLGTPFDSILLKEFVPNKLNDVDILFGIYQMIEKYKTDAIRLELTTIDCDLCSITIRLIKTKEGE